MVEKKDKAGKKTSSTRTIKATEVKIENGFFVDEEGNIADKVKDLIPDGFDTFTMTIKFDIPDEDVEED